MSRKFLPLICVFLSGVCFPALSNAQSVPSAADVSRITADQTRKIDIPQKKPEISAPSAISQKAPDGASDIKFLLRDIQFAGNTAFNGEELKASYKSLIGTTISLDKAWAISEGITNKYRQAGYFLSRAYIPAQEIEDGVLKINIVEGFIEDVRVTADHPLNHSSLLDKWIADIKIKHPIRTEDLENALLELNRGSGYQYRAVLLPPKLAKGLDGAADLELVETKSKGLGFAQVDNYGSKFLGVHEIRANYSQSFLPGQNTNLSFLSSVPVKQINNASVEHSIYLMPKLSLVLSGNYTRTAPGYSLKSQDIKGRSYGLGLGLNYQWFLHRNEELSTKIGFDRTNSKSDILSTLLSEDKVSVLRLGTHYSTYDSWLGYNDVNFTLSKGVEGLGGSKKGDTNLSRAEATPDFTKLEIFYMRQQPLPHNLKLTYKLRGQLSTDPLYSSEEFGFGGQEFGRAYDSSDIVGDKGVSTAIEVGYLGMRSIYQVNMMPFLFYDIGKVWNLDKTGQIASQSGSSAGGGLKFYSQKTGINAGIGLAFPLTKPIENPIYGGAKASPRVLFEMGYVF